MYLDLVFVKHYMFAETKRRRANNSQNWTIYPVNPRTIFWWAWGEGQIQKVIICCNVYVSYESQESYNKTRTNRP